ncbi:MAG: DUF342 domain-containing protein [Deltaproteobacteria bacterium]|nr:DUF342 domain-containing protein [Deltaproteobacteria bacterium]
MASKSTSGDGGLKSTPAPSGGGKSQPVKKESLPPTDGRVVITVEPGDMKATLAIIPPQRGGKDVSYDVVIKAMKEAGVVAGLLGENISQAVIRAKNEQVPLAVDCAMGVEPVPGKDGYVKYYFDTEPVTVGKVDETGRIDFRERGQLPMVNKDDLLAQKFPRVESKDGIDIRGRKFKGLPTKNATVKVGQGATLVDDKVFATCSGGAVLISGKIKVLNIRQISGDVNLSVGNINFNGLVKVTGTIAPGFKVTAESLVVDMVDKGAVVKVSGDMVVAKGIINARVEVGGTLSADYILASRVIVTGDILVKNTIHTSEVMCGGRLGMTKSDAAIRGGTIICAKGLDVVNLGHEETKTSVSFGIDPIQEMELRRLMAEQSGLDMKIEALENELSPIKKNLDKIPKYKCALEEVGTALDNIHIHIKKLVKAKETLSDQDKIEKVDIAVYQQEKLYHEAADRRDKLTRTIGVLTKQAKLSAESFEQLEELKKQHLALAEEIEHTKEIIRESRAAVDATIKLIVRGHVSPGTDLAARFSKRQIHDSLRGPLQFYETIKTRQGAKDEIMIEVRSL